MALGRIRRGVARYGARGFVKTATLRAFLPALAPTAGRRLRDAAARTSDLEELVDLAFRFNELGFTLDLRQERREITELLELLRPRRCSRMVEIGTSTGGSLFLFRQVIAPDAEIVSIDLPKGQFGGGYSAWRGSFYRAFGPPGQRLRLLRADSHARQTVEALRELLDGELLDFLFIDGDHTYEGVRRDFEIYSSLVRGGGVIALHDIAPGDTSEEAAAEAETWRDKGGDVPRYWHELEAGQRTQALRYSPVGLFGIGVVFVD